ncbi:MAG: family efflux transporter [Fusobacteriales bacterium]|jgi:putative MATE family efflux protein|nr:family efflux transporter [Fusobacteriales bacterium]
MFKYLKSNKSLMIQILIISFPVIIQMYMKTAIGTIDKIMIGQLGEAAISGVGASNQIMFLMMMIFTAIGMGVGIIASQAVGAKEFSKIKLIFGSSIIIGIIFGLFFNIIFLFFPQFFLKIIGAKSEILNAGSLYLKIVSFTIIPGVLSFILTGIFRAFTDNNILLYSSFFAASINLILDYLFIIVFKMGILGAALATVISSFIEISIMFFFLFKNRIRYHINISDTLKFSKNMFIQMISLGWPISIDTFLWRISAIIMISMILRLGVVASGANEVINLVKNLFLLPTFAIGSAISGLIGQKIGSKNFDEVVKISKLLFYIMFVILFVFSILLSMFSYFVPKVFNFKYETKILIQQILIFYGFLQFPQIANSIYPNILRAGGDTKIIIFITSISSYLFLLPFVYIFAFIFKLGLIGVIIGEFLGETIKAIFFYYRYKKNIWQKNIL